MKKSEPAEAWFTLKLTFGEAKALRSQIGDIPKSRVGPRLVALYRSLNARLLLVGSIDDDPPRLTLVRGGAAPVKRVRQKRSKRVEAAS